MPDKSVVLVNSNRLRPGCPPVALDYLAAACDQKGIKVEILDLCYSEDVKGDIRAFFKDRKPDLVGVTIRNLDDVFHSIFFLPGVKTIIDELKECAEAPIVLGGSGFSIAPEQVLDYFGVDLGVAGEGEEALPMLVNSVGNTSEYGAIPGLVYRVDGEIKRNPLGMMDLSEINVSKRGYVDHAPYVNDPKAKTKTGGVQTKRGCPSSCIYCVVPAIEGNCMRPRPVEHIVDEIEVLLSQGVNAFWFADSEFNYPEDHAKYICREILRRGLQDKIAWNAYIAPKPFSRELAELMRDAGCKLAVNCIDHSCDTMLEKLGRDFRMEDIGEAVVAARDAGLPVAYCLMFGGPGDSLDTALKTLESMLALKPIKVTLGDPPGIRVYPNSPLAEMVREEGFSKKNRNLSGKIKGNEGLLEPVFYLSSGLRFFGPMVRVWRTIGKWRYQIRNR